MASSSPTQPHPVHVQPDRLGRWSVLPEGDGRPLSEHGSATEAELAAHATGREVVLHDRYGRTRRVPSPRARLAGTPPQPVTEDT